MFFIESKSFVQSLSKFSTGHDSTYSFCQVFVVNVEIRKNLEEDVKKRQIFYTWKIGTFGGL